MTISSTVNRLGYSGNGSTTAFSVSMKFIDPEDLNVYIGDTLKVLDTDYAVTGGNGATGTVTFVVAPDADASIVIVRDPAVLQETDYVANDPFPAETHERALDRLTMIAQRNRDLLDRSLTLSDTTPAGVTTQLPTPSANEVIAWNAAANALENKTVAELATAVIGAQTVRDRFSGTGAQTAFTLSAAPQADNNTMVFVGGVYQEASEYSVSGTTLTFTAAPPSGTNNIEVRQQEAFTYPITSLTDSVVTTSKINDGAVTPAKLSAAFGAWVTAASAVLARSALGLGTAATSNTGDFQAADADIPTVAGSQAEMEAGTETALRSMSPLRVKQAIKALAGAGPTPSMVRLHTSPGSGSTNTVIRRITTVVTNQGSDITYADSASLGATFTINTTGTYSISYTDHFGSAVYFGLSLNATGADLTTSILSISIANVLAVINVGSNTPATVSWTGQLTAGDVVRMHTNGVTTTGANNIFTICRVA